MAVTSFQDFELADRDRAWDGQAAGSGFAPGLMRTTGSSAG